MMLPAALLLLLPLLLSVLLLPLINSLHTPNKGSGAKVCPLSVWKAESEEKKVARSIRARPELLLPLLFAFIVLLLILLLPLVLLLLPQRR